MGSDLAIRVATLPAPHDPDSFIKEFGAEAFQTLIGKAEAFFDFYLGRLCSTNDAASDKGQQTIIRAMAEAVGKTGDEGLLDKYSRKTAARLGLNPTSALDVFRRALQRPAAIPQPEPEPELPVEETAPVEEPMPKPSQPEFWLLRLILLHDEVLDWCRAHLATEWIHHPVVRTIIAHRLSFDDDGQPKQPVQILDEMDASGARALITEALIEARSIPKPDQQVIDLVTRLRNNHIDKLLASVMQQLGPENLAAETSAALLQEQRRLRMLKRTPVGSEPQ